jgi:hypothetical protein
MPRPSDRVATPLSAEQALARMDAQLDFLIRDVVPRLPAWWHMPLVIAATICGFAALLRAEAFFSACGWL